MAKSLETLPLFAACQWPGCYEPYWKACSCGLLMCRKHYPNHATDRDREGMARMSSRSAD